MEDRELQPRWCPAVEATDLGSIATSFAVPFFVFQGALDRVTPAQAVQTYVETIAAPHKELVLIPNVGHNVMVTKSDEFLGLLVEKVRPFAVRSP